MQHLHQVEIRLLVEAGSHQRLSWGKVHSGLPQVISRIHLLEAIGPRSFSLLAAGQSCTQLLEAAWQFLAMALSKRPSYNIASSFFKTSEGSFLCASTSINTHSQSWLLVGICELAYLLNFLCNLKINTWSALGDIGARPHTARTIWVARQFPAEVQEDSTLTSYLSNPTAMTGGWRRDRAGESRAEGLHWLPSG